MRMARIIGAIAAFGGLASAVALEAETPLPQYRFEPGQELIYRLTGSENLFEQKEGDERPMAESEWSIYPVRQNEDGSWRLLIRRLYRSFSREKDQSGQAEVHFENDFLGYCDLRPDGSYEKNSSCGPNSLFQLQPEEIFIQFPADAAALEGGWEYDGPTNGADYSFTAEPVKGNLLRITGTYREPSDANYELTRRYTVDFDAADGVIAKRVLETKADWDLNPGHNRATFELVAKKVRGADWLKTFAAEADAYLDAARQSWKAGEAAAAARTAADARAALDKVRRRLEELQEQAKTDEMKELYAAHLKLHDRDAEWAVQEAAEREKLYARAPVDWETTDFKDQPRKQVDYRGKVIVTDFWYRGCGHCIDALPKIKHLAAKYQDDPVAVLGINNDTSDANARFVIDEFELTYPNLRNGDISKEYGVSGWPMVIVLDQAGKVALFHSGNSEDLVETISGVVDGLLANPVDAAD